MTITGIAAPGRVGQTVALQVYTSSGWKTVASAKTASNGANTARWKPTKMGIYQLRTVAGTTSTTTSGTSATITFIKAT